MPRRPQGDAARRLGFSLPELLLILAILGILFRAVGPRFADSFSHQVLRSASDEFTANLNLARASAQRYGRTAQMHVDTATGRFFVDIDTSGANQRGRLGRSHDVGAKGVRIVQGDTLFCFDARGISTTTTPCHNGAATFVFRRATKGATTDQVSLQVTAFGKVIR